MREEEIFKGIILRDYFFVRVPVAANPSKPSCTFNVSLKTIVFNPGPL